MFAKGLNGGRRIPGLGCEQDRLVLMSGVASDTSLRLHSMYEDPHAGRDMYAIAIITWTFMWSIGNGRSVT